MQESVKLKVPYVLDDPLVGRCSSPFPLTGGYDHITIMNGMIDYTEAFENRPKRIFKINDIQKIVVIRRELSCWTKDHKLDPWAKIGAEMEVIILANDGTSHVLIPAFSIRYGANKWDQFLNELSEASGIAIEEKRESQKYKK